MKSEGFFVFFFSFQDVDDFFEHERTFLVEYHNRVKDASAKSDKMTRSHKSEFIFQQERCVRVHRGDLWGAIVFTFLEKKVNFSKHSLLVIKNKV